MKDSTRNRADLIIAYYPNASLPWYVSVRTFNENSMPVPGRTLAECRDEKVAIGVVDRYIAGAFDA